MSGNSALSLLFPCLFLFLGIQGVCVLGGGPCTWNYRDNFSLPLLSILLLPSPLSSSLIPLFSLLLPLPFFPSLPFFSSFFSVPLLLSSFLPSSQLASTHLHLLFILLPSLLHLYFSCLLFSFPTNLIGSTFFQEAP